MSCFAARATCYVLRGIAYPECPDRYHGAVHYAALHIRNVLIGIMTLRCIQDIVHPQCTERAALGRPAAAESAVE